MIKSSNLCFTYQTSVPSNYVLNDISVEINEGEFVAILGRNGSGKSTLARHMNALLTPTSGTLWVKGLDTSKEENIWQVRQTTGMVFQNPDNQIVATLVEDDVAFGPENLGVRPSEIIKRVDSNLNIVRMGNYKKTAPHNLSGGQKQRVAIAGILAMKPSCIVFDEATAMLDPLGRNEVLETAKQLNVEEGITVILITHFMEEALLADRVFVMNDGKVEIDASPKKIFTDANKIKSLGLAVPSITELCSRLAVYGVSSEIVSDDEFINDEVIRDLLSHTNECILMSQITDLPVSPCLTCKFHGGVICPPATTQKVKKCTLPSSPSTTAQGQYEKQNVEITHARCKKHFNVTFPQQPYEKGNIDAILSVEKKVTLLHDLRLHPTENNEKTLEDVCRNDYISSQGVAIKVSNLTHTYGVGSVFEKNAICDVSMDIVQGKITAIIGHTGSGKSTLVQHFNALLSPTSGTVLVEGENIHANKNKLQKFRQKVGIIFQYPEYQLFESTVMKDVCFGPRQMEMDAPAAVKSAKEALEAVGIPESMYGKSPFELSGGQKRRVAIAGVLAMQPSILVLDEPTAGLDPSGKEEILSHIMQLHWSKNITVVLVSHNMDDVALLSDRIFVVNAGRLLLSGTPKEVFKERSTLNEIGLDVPKINRLFLRLYNLYPNIPKDVLTIDEAEAVFKKLFEVKI